MKQTADDLRFAGDFAQALAPHVSADRKKGRSLKDVARDLGITEPALKKCLGGRNTPSLRTVVLAFDKYGVSIPYSGVTFIGRDVAARKGRKKPSSLNQLLLPFEIETPSPEDRLTLKLLPTGVRRYQLQVKLRLAR